MFEVILVKSEERLVIREDCKDRSMSLRVESITGWPEVGKEVIEECKAWLDKRGLKAWASICGCGDRCGGALRHILAFARLPVRGSHSGECAERAGGFWLQDSSGISSGRSVKESRGAAFGVTNLPHRIEIEGGQFLGLVLLQSIPGHDVRVPGCHWSKDGGGLCICVGLHHSVALPGLKSSVLKRASSFSVSHAPPQCSTCWCT